MDQPLMPDRIEDLRHFLALVGCAHAKAGKCAPFDLRRYAEGWVRDKISLAHCYQRIKGRYITDSQLPDLDRLIRRDWAARLRSARAMPSETSGLLERETVVDEAEIAAPANVKPIKALTKAVDFLRAKLRDGEVEANVVETDANKAGVSARTLDRARAKLGVASRRTGFGRNGKSWLSLPTTPTGMHRTP